MLNPMRPFKEGDNVDSTCNSCELGDAPLRIRAMLVNSKDRPQNQVPAIVILATRQPPTIVTEQGVVRNPKLDLLDVVRVATWEMVEEICNDKACYDAMMNRLWNLAQRNIKLLWGRE